jgi:hypothetical protein
VPLTLNEDAARELGDGDCKDPAFGSLSPVWGTLLPLADFKSLAKSRQGSEEVESDLGTADVLLRVNKRELHGVGQFTTPEPAAASGELPQLPAGDGPAFAASKVASELPIGLSASSCKRSSVEGDDDLADAMRGPASQLGRELDWSEASGWAGSLATSAPVCSLLQLIILRSSQRRKILG